MNLSPKAKNILSFLLRFLLSFALLAYLFGKIDWAATASIVKTVDPVLLFYGACTYAFIIFMLLVRWMVLIRALELDAPFITVMRYFFIGLFGNLFLPTAIGGDVVKVLGLCRDSSQKPKVVASVVIDRLSGFGGMVLVSVVSFVFGYRLIDDPSVLALIVAMAILSSVLAAVLFNEKPYAFCSRIFKAFPRIQQGLMKVHYDAALLKDKRYAIYQAVGISALCQIFLAITYFLVAEALHQDVAMIYFFIFVPLTCVVASFPSIGGLGVREAGTAYLLAKVGIETGIAVSISLVNYIFMVLTGLVGGVIYITVKSPPRSCDSEKEILGT